VLGMVQVQVQFDKQAYVPVTLKGLPVSRTPLRTMFKIAGGKRLPFR